MSVDTKQKKNQSNEITKIFKKRRVLQYYNKNYNKTKWMALFSNTWTDSQHF